VDCDWTAVGILDEFFWNDHGIKFYDWKLYDFSESD
jgi:hypothetical protein